jgi:hypothetical protein
MDLHPPQKKLLLTKPRGGKDPHRVVAPIKKKKDDGLKFNLRSLKYALYNYYIQ